MKRILAIFAAVLAICTTDCHAQKSIKDDFEPVCKVLDTLIRMRTSVMGELKLNSVMLRGNSLDFYFDNSLSDLPWTADDYRWFCRELKERFPAEYRRYSLGRISSRGEKLPDLVTGELSATGRPAGTSYRTEDRRPCRHPIVEKTGSRRWSKGLDRSHIALWQSHGLYYEQAEGRWEWQRPCLFQTVEDLFTQGYVLPYLVPMLENAGAYVMLPRERDINKTEIIIDNDPDFRSDSTFKASAAPAGLRLSGQYSEEGGWKDAGEGFADAKAIYSGEDNPFLMGTARAAKCATLDEGTGAFARIKWTPDIPERGEYAVYISYKTLPNSTETAHYTVRHMGGETGFLVNQQMGGSTWIYLGTFEFDKGADGYVMLDNLVSAEKADYKSYIAKLEKASVVKIENLEDFEKAINERLDFFVSRGCRFSDIGVAGFPKAIAERDQAAETFKKILCGGATAEETDAFKGYLYVYLAKEYKKRGITMQMHLAVTRNSNGVMFEKCGADSGFDCVGDAIDTVTLTRVIDAMNRACGLPETIIYTLNPSMYYTLITMIGAFRNVHLGVSWWFCDHKRGMRETFDRLSELGHICSMVGMLTDSRSFLSYTRHDYYRQCLCDFLADNSSERDGDAPTEVAKKLCYYNAKKLTEE